MYSRALRTLARRAVRKNSQCPVKSGPWTRPALVRTKTCLIENSRSISVWDRSSLTSFIFPNSSRSFSSQTNSGLRKALDEEIQHEKEHYEPSETVKDGPPSPFTLDEKSGAAEVILRRTYNNEDIAVVASVTPEDYPPEPEDDDDAESVPEAQVVVQVSVSKGGDDAPLEFECILSGDSWEIEKVTLDPFHGNDEETLPYDGPDYAMLDQGLQDQFSNYLADRGFDGDLAFYIREALHDKEQREYTRWLTSVRKFVSN